MIMNASGCTILSSSNGPFASPKYPKKYDNNLNVCWFIDGQDYVSISFPFLYTDYQQDFVRVYGGNSTSSSLLLETSGPSEQESGSAKNKGYRGYYKHAVVSPTKEMLIVFNTGKLNGTGLGFEARYSSCFIWESTSGTISSPNYPKYDTTWDSVCWVIKAPVGYVVSLYINYLSGVMSKDYVRVFDGDSNNSPELFSVSGNFYAFEIPDVVTSSSNIMLIVYSRGSSSNTVPGNHGFHATYHLVLVG